jgi:pyrroloquinoline quinone biosynthesis protein B
VSVDGTRWFLLNASPDIQKQLSWLRPAENPSSPRHVPFEGVVFTDAEIDHTLGMVLLREGRALSIFTTKAAESILERDSRFIPLVRAFARVHVTHLTPDKKIALTCRDGSSSGLIVEPFIVPAGPPRFATNDEAGHTIGLMIQEASTGGICAFVPGCGRLDEPLLERLGRADALLFDGTFWSDRELIDLGIGDRTAREMDHVPISGPGGSLERLAALPCKHRIYTHINNTNPILIEGSSEQQAVTRAGMTVGIDGLRMTI